MLIFWFLLNCVCIIIGIVSSTAVSTNNDLKFYEEPSDTYLTKNMPAILKCKIENARTGFFKCNDQWSQDPVNSKQIQIGNKQILSIELGITKSQLDEYKKSIITSNTESLSLFWCTCQGWLNSADDTIISRKAHIKLAYIDQTFEWEPMPTSGLIGKSVEIRCLPPDGDPKPAVYWLKNSSPIEKTNKRVLVSHEGSLLINEVRNSDAANYTCVAENLAGKRLSDPAMLTVTENKGWSEWSNWTDCASLSMSTCGEGVQKRSRTCLNPPTINNAIGCDGFPQQTITCYVPCNGNNNNNNDIKPNNNENNLNNNNNNPGASSNNNKNIESDKKSNLYANLKPSSLLPESAYLWSHWSSWSMVCNSDCMRSRRRDCKSGYINTHGKFVAISEEKINLKLVKCPGTDVEYGNCSFYCEPVTSPVTIDPDVIKDSIFANRYMISMIVIAVIVVVGIILSILFKRKFYPSKERKTRSPIVNDHNPIYYSVQPDYTQDTYMDVCTLLSPNLPNGLSKSLTIGGNGMLTNGKVMNGIGFIDCNPIQNNMDCTNYLNVKTNSCNGTCSGGSSASSASSSASSSNDDHCDASRNSTTTTTSGSSSTTSSKIKLTSSPTDSLVKSSTCLQHQHQHNQHNQHQQHTTSNSNHNCLCCSINHDMIQLEDYENNAYQIMKLINERKTCVCPTKAINNKSFNSNFDLFAFNLFKSGGLIEIPKYSTHLLIPDETFVNDISVGIYKIKNQNLFHLRADQTLLSSIFVVKTDNYQTYTKPIILSIDHAAQFVETDWQTSIYYKSPNSQMFEEINEQTDQSLYFHIVANRCYIMTEKDGMYALVGRPKYSSSVPNVITCTKEMKYAIILVDDVVKIYITQNTRAATEIVYEEIQKTNGKIIKMPELFELSFPKKLNLENSYLNLEANVIYNNQVINSDSTCRRVKMSDLWSLNKDFVEIEMPVTINNLNKCQQQQQQQQTTISNEFSKSQSFYNIHPNATNTNTIANTGNNTLNNMNNGKNHKLNFDLNVLLKLENKLIFSYSNSNTTTADLHTANCNQQEFYSSVSVNPVFIPLKITALLDEYVMRCFKMNTLKRNDWRLFANLLKCDKNVQYFSNKENSFELVISLWLMINLTRSENENLTVNLINKYNV